MAKAGTVGEHALDTLRDAYIEMKTKKSEVRQSVKDRHRKMIEAEIEAETLSIERWFAVQLVTLREAGATRKELVSVISDGSADVMRRYIELGGGRIAGRQSGTERLSVRAESAGITRIGDNLFDITLAIGDVVSVYLTWAEGKPAIWSDDRETLTKMHEEFKNGGGLYRKGAEIAALFGIEES